MTLPPLNMLSDEFRADPYPYYREYRAQDPVHRGVPLQPGRAAPWFLFRYRDIVPLLRDQRAGRGGLVANREQVEPELGRFRSMLHMDPPDHTRLRNLVSKAFTPRHIALQRERIVSLANEVLDEALEQDSIDVIADLAYPLPVSVIGAMLGVPTDERQLLRTWSRAITANLDATNDQATFAAGRAASQELASYLAEAVADHRRRPREDLLGALLAARDQEDRLTEDELITTVVLLIVAGHETTVNLIGNGLLALLQHPDQLEALRAGGVTPAAVDELLRYDPPVQATVRQVYEPIQLEDRQFEPGDDIVLVLAAANRDPEVFDRPDVLDVTRAGNRHLSFGGGIHVCLGAPLARLEGEVALETLLSRYRRIELADERPVWRPGPLFRGLETLPVVVQ